MNTQRSKAPGRPPVVIVTGPTASGKSGLALALAEARGGVVINADAMQLYRDLALLTARPGPAALARVPHRLYGVLPADMACSAGRWRELALAEVAAAHGAGRLPILVGGTGLYLRAVSRGLAAMPEVPAATRAAARARHRKLGGAAFHAELAARDPAMAARLEPGDSQRLVRAWEVLEATGRSLAEWQAGDAGPPPDLRFLWIQLMPPREALYAGCDGRFRSMLAAGALDEVRALMALRLDPALPILRALGVPELAAHLAGRISRAAAVAQAQQATRRYAKRQMTWLRTQTPADMCRGDAPPVILGAQYSESFEAEIVNKIREYC